MFQHGKGWRWPLLCLVCLMLQVPAMAAEKATGTIVTLDASAEQWLPNDEVVVIYRIEATGKQAARLRQQVDRISQHVHAVLDREKSLRQMTLGRSMNALWHRDKKQRRMRDGWQLVQREQVVSSSPESLADWVVAIEQAGGHLEQVSFRISSQAMQQARKELRRKAIRHFLDRAATIAASFSATSFHVRTVQTGWQLPQPLRAEHRAMAARESGPSFRAGQGLVRVTVSGEIELPFRKFSVH